MGVKQQKFYNELPFDTDTGSDNDGLSIKEVLNCNGLKSSDGYVILTGDGTEFLISIGSINDLECD